MIVPFICGVVVTMAGFCGARVGRWVFRRYQQWRIERWHGRIVEINRVMSGKYLRHRPTGRIGLCTGAGLSSKYQPMVEVVTCKGCASTIARVGVPAMFWARMNGCALMMPHADMVAALSSEIDEFKSSQEGAPEG